MKLLISILFIFSLGSSVGQGVYTLKFNVRADSSEIFKIYCNVESKNWVDEENLIFWKEGNNMGSYEFQFDSRYKNIRLMWINENNVELGKITVTKPTGEQLTWSPDEIISFYDFSALISIKNATDSLLSLRGGKPNPQLNDWSFIELNSLGAMELESFYNGGSILTNNLELSLRTRDDLLARIYANDGPISDDLVLSGRKYIPANNDFAIISIPLYSENGFSKVRIILNNLSRTDSAQVEIGSLEVDNGEFTRIFEPQEISNYFNFYGYGTRSKEFLEFDFDSNLYVESSKEIIQKWKEYLVAAGLLTLFTISTLLLLKLNTVILGEKIHRYFTGSSFSKLAQRQ